MKFDVKEFNRLIEEDLNEVMVKDKLELEIKHLEETLLEKERQLELLTKTPVRVEKATTYFHNYLEYYQSTMVLPKKVKTISEEVA